MLKHVLAPGSRLAARRGGAADSLSRDLTRYVARGFGYAAGHQLFVMLGVFGLAIALVVGFLETARRSR